LAAAFAFYVFSERYFERTLEEVKSEQEAALSNLVKTIDTVNTNFQTKVDRSISCLYESTISFQTNLTQSLSDLERYLQGEYEKISNEIDMLEDDARDLGRMTDELEKRVREHINKTNQLPTVVYPTT
jgi:hypothetical protein